MFSFYEKQVTKTMLWCVRLTWFGIIFSDYHASVWYMVLLHDGKITRHLLLFLPFQFIFGAIQQISVFFKLRESFLSIAQLCYWYHENRQCRRFILQKKKKRMTCSTTNKFRFFIEFILPMPLLVKQFSSSGKFYLIHILSLFPI